MNGPGIGRDAASAVGFGGKPPPRGMRLISFKPMAKGALRGFASVRLPNGLLISECPVCIGTNGKAWAALPSKPVLDHDGRQIEANGKRQYAAILSWPDRSVQDRWSEAVVELIRAAHPEALDDGRVL